MKLVYFILSLLLGIPAKGGKGRCEQGFNDSFPCQCTSTCKMHRDCCEDYDDSCPKELCVDSCGQPFDKRHRCQCNTDCQMYNNCCDDYDAFCVLGVNELSTTNYITSDTTSNTSVNEVSTANYISSETTFINSEIIVAIVLSITVVILILVVVLSVMFRRKFTKEKCPSSTVGMGDRKTNETDNCTDKLEYEQLDIVRKDKSTNAYDELHVTHEDDKNLTNTHVMMTSREDDSKYKAIKETTQMYYNAVSSEYEQLENFDKDKCANVYDQLHVTNTH
ncbi:uncharacterized protein LOC134690378 isoform X2 [Mytilus trossulus]|uniref:uncharacterized protein LOC134690378 isoform X2 n=1 Tax=Mytilus trossulus TaxID=6551 RepID=UPI0030068BDA